MLVLVLRKSETQRPGETRPGGLGLIASAATPEAEKGYGRPSAPGAHTGAGRWEEPLESGPGELGALCWTS